MLGTGDHPVRSVFHGTSFHSFEVRTSIWLGHRDALALLTAHHRFKEVTNLVIHACGQDGVGPAHALCQRQGCAGQALFDQREGNAVQTSPTYAFRHIAGMQTEINGFAADIQFELAR
ncbi:hypothetical protein D3C85_1429860 [compost metagenome]